MSDFDVEFSLGEQTPIEAQLSIDFSGITEHQLLSNRDLPDQHPISAITDLTETLSGIGGNIGDLENLTTENKGSLVSSINEVDSHADVNASNIGTLSSLTTTAKDSLVSAINEVDSHADTNATNLSNHIADKNNPHEVTKSQVGLGNCDNTSDLDKPISTATQAAITAEENRAKGVEGSLSNLTTTDKSNLVSAINELDSDKQDNLSAGTGIDITANIVSVTDPTLVNNGTGTNALAVGKSSQATGEGGVSVGQGARANSTYATAVGQETRATNTNTVALGRGAKATQQRAIAIGSGAEANAQDAIAIKGVNNTANTFQVYTYQMLDMSNGLIPNARINIDSTPTENSTNTVSSGGVYTMVNNVITGTTNIDYDNTTSGLSATTIKGAIDEIDGDLDNVEALIPSGATSSNQLADKSYVDTADGGLQSQITTNAGDIDTIEGKIPSAASSSNQLADKNFVNSSISTNTANFIGTFNSVADLEAYSGTLTNNDYAFVIVTDSLGNTAYDRYKYTTATTPASWQFEYELNNSSFTSDQWAAINSGATTTNIGQIATNTSAISGLSTSKQDKIDNTHKLDSDLVDDTNQTNKFVTASEKSQIATNKNAIGTLSNLNTTTKTNLVSAINEVDGVASTALQPNDNISSLTNDSGYITGITSGDVTTALGYTPVDPSNLATVATSGSYNDLTNKPTIPIVNNATLTIQKNGTTVQTFTANQSTNATANITVPTQASDINAADTSLSNLDSTGQMIVDSQNGTISNCILEIPQNIKLTLENNVLTLKAGSVLTRTGSTYDTYITSSDVTLTISSSLADGRYEMFTLGNAFHNPRILSKISSGNSSSFPTTDLNDYNIYFNTDDKLLYRYNNSTQQWDVNWTIFYPVCCIDIKSGVASFAKDSNGNDMIFNGACFVGHHAVVYPNVSGLISQGLNSDGTLKNVKGIVNGVYVLDLGTNSSRYITIGTTTSGEYNKAGTQYAVRLNNPSDSYGVKFDSDKNRYIGIGANNTGVEYDYVLAGYAKTDSSSIVTDFAVYEPIKLITSDTIHEIDYTSISDYIHLTGYESYEDLQGVTASCNDLYVTKPATTRVYNHLTSGDSQQITNRPITTTDNFRLISETIRYGGTSDNAVKQTYISNNERATYIRYLRNGNWTSWCKDAVLDGTVPNVITASTNGYDLLTQPINTILDLEGTGATNSPQGDSSFYNNGLSVKLGYSDNLNNNWFRGFYLYGQWANGHSLWYGSRAQGGTVINWHPVAFCDKTNTFRQKQNIYAGSNTVTTQKITDATRGTAPSAEKQGGFQVFDKDGNELNSLVYKYLTSGKMYSVWAVNNGSKIAVIRLGIDENNVIYTNCPTPTEDTTSSIQIDTVGARNTKINSVLGDIETILASI